MTFRSDFAIRPSIYSLGLGHPKHWFLPLEKNDGSVWPKNKNDCDEEWIRFCFYSVHKMQKIFPTLPNGRIGLVSCLSLGRPTRREKIWEMRETEQKADGNTVCWGVDRNNDMQTTNENSQQ